MIALGHWIGDYQLIFMGLNPDGTIQHRFNHRGMKWGFILKSAADVTDEELTAVAIDAGPKSEANYHAGLVADAERAALASAGGEG